MALALIRELRSRSIDYIVAPYEADAQLAFLDKENLVDAIITEDSDLFVFGCRRVKQSSRSLFYDPLSLSGH